MNECKACQDMTVGTFRGEAFQKSNLLQEAKSGFCDLHRHCCTLTLTRTRVAWFVICTATRGTQTDTDRHAHTHRDTEALQPHSTICCLKALVFLKALGDLSSNPVSFLKASLWEVHPTSMCILPPTWHQQKTRRSCAFTRLMDVRLLR